MEKFSIGETARLTGLSTKTIRFYEDEGVISSAVRTDNGYRTYSEAAIEELKVLKYARDLGLPLSEIKKLILGCDSGDCQHSREYIQKSIKSYLGLLETRIDQMETLRQKLTGLNQKINTTEIQCGDGKYCCNILHQLINETAKGGEDR
jgi:DNA-binding transcriptional MerR regulator